MKKRALSLLMALVMVVGLLPATVRAAETETNELSVTQAAAPEAADGTLSGKGTFAEPYLISSADDLKTFRGRVNGGENPACARLTKDIKLNGEEWTPITNLIGYLDGDGHTISGLTLKGGTGKYGSPVNTGLIGELNGSIINLNVTNVNITEDIGDYNNVGALVGKIAEGSTSKIDNCTVDGAITCSAGGSYTYIGSLAGVLKGTSTESTKLTINNCNSKVTVSSAQKNYAGGLIGTVQNYGDAIITKCAILSDIDSKSVYNAGAAGGLFGSIAYTVNIQISDSYLGGKIDGGRKYGIAYNTTAPTSLICKNFYYDNEKNTNSFEMVKNKGYSSNVQINATGKTTAALKALVLDGFAVRDGKFDGYPVPVYTKAEPLPLPKITVSAKVEFTNTEGGTVTVTDPSGETVEPNEDKA